MPYAISYTILYLMQYLIQSCTLCIHVYPILYLIQYLIQSYTLCKILYNLIPYAISYNLIPYATSYTILYLVQYLIQSYTLCNILYNLIPYAVSYTILYIIFNLHLTFSPFHSMYGLQTALKSSGTEWPKWRFKSPRTSNLRCAVCVATITATRTMIGESGKRVPRVQTWAKW